MATKSPPCWTMVTSVPLFCTIDQTPATNGYSPVVRQVGFTGSSRGFSFFCCSGEVSFGFLTCCLASGINRAARAVFKPARCSANVNHNCPSHPGGAHCCKSSSYRSCLPRSTYSSGTAFFPQ